MHTTIEPAGPRQNIDKDDVGKIINMVSVFDGYPIISRIKVLSILETKFLGELEDGEQKGYSICGKLFWDWEYY